MWRCLTRPVVPGTDPACHAGLLSGDSSSRMSRSPFPSVALCQQPDPSSSLAPQVPRPHVQEGCLLRGFLPGVVEDCFLPLFLVASGDTSRELRAPLGGTCHCDAWPSWSGHPAGSYPSALPHPSPCPFVASTQSCPLGTSVRWEIAVRRWGRQLWPFWKLPAASLQPAKAEATVREVAEAAPWQAATEAPAGRPRSK